MTSLAQPVVGGREDVHGEGSGPLHLITRDIAALITDFSAKRPS